MKCSHSFAFGIKGKFVFQMSFSLFSFHVYGQGISVFPQCLFHGVDAVAAQAEISKQPLGGVHGIGFYHGHFVFCKSSGFI